MKRMCLKNGTGVPFNWIDTFFVSAYVHAHIRGSPFLHLPFPFVFITAFFSLYVRTFRLWVDDSMAHNNNIEKRVMLIIFTIGRAWNAMSRVIRRTLFDTLNPKARPNRSGSDCERTTRGCVVQRVCASAPTGSAASASSIYFPSLRYRRRR